MPYELQAFYDRLDMEREKLEREEKVRAQEKKLQDEIRAE